MQQTFYHHDAFERNMFYRGAELVLIDWNFAGIAPPGSTVSGWVSYRILPMKP